MLATRGMEIGSGFIGIRYLFVGDGRSPPPVLIPPKLYTERGGPAGAMAPVSIARIRSR